MAAGMNRARTLAGCGLTVAVLLAGCQSAGTARSGGTAQPGTAAVTTPATDFRDPAQLATDLEAQINQRISDPTDAHYSPGLTVVSVQCVPINGSRTDFECVDKDSNGATSEAEAIVAPDGQSYVTK